MFVKSDVKTEQHYIVMDNTVLVRVLVLSKQREVLCVLPNMLLQERSN